MICPAAEQSGPRSRGETTSSQTAFFAQLTCQRAARIRLLSAKSLAGVQRKFTATRSTMLACHQGRVCPASSHSWGNKQSFDGPPRSLYVLAPPVRLQYASVPSVAKRPPRRVYIPCNFPATEAREPQAVYQSRQGTCVACEAFRVFETLSWPAVASCGQLWRACLENYPAVAHPPRTFHYHGLSIFSMHGRPNGRPPAASAATGSLRTQALGE